MDITFISIHDTSKHARILYASSSIEYMLGHQPQEVTQKSCWDFFHPDEIPFAQNVLGRGVRLDKAANLKYCRIKHKLGFWVCCECVFSVVYNVVVACTSVYQQGASSQKRALDAPIIRKMFTSSPLDPRYHMLSYLSSKFSQPPEQSTNELRAALFLNRFSRTLTIMFATDNVAEILGATPQQLVSKSFYYCIQENSLRDAVRCLESAKANNSIAYLRFWYRDPLQDEGNDLETMVHGDSAINQTELRISMSQYSSGSSETLRSEGLNSNTIHTEPQPSQRRPSQTSVEVEAVVSCTSDGLVVILRRARPMIPQQEVAQSVGTSGLFASPWATQPIFPQRNPVSPHMPMPGHYYQPHVPVNPQIYPGYYGYNPNPTAMSTTSLPFGSAGPPSYYSEQHPHDLLQTIREVAVFAWGVVGINGSLERFKSGRPQGDALPVEGVQVWDALAASKQENASETVYPQDRLHEEDEELERDKLEYGDSRELA